MSASLQDRATVTVTVEYRDEPNPRLRHNYLRIRKKTNVRLIGIQNYFFSVFLSNHNYAFHSAPDVTGVPNFIEIGQPAAEL